MVGWKLIAAVLALAAPAPRASQSFAEVAGLAREGRFVEAHALAAAIADPLASAQARVHVLWTGGDLLGALAEGENALQRFPGDLYLLEQCSQLALALGASARARTHAESLVARVHEAELAEDDRRAWNERAESAHRAAAALVELHEQRTGSLVRARGTVLFASLLAALLLLLPWQLVRRTARAG